MPRLPPPAILLSTAAITHRPASLLVLPAAAAVLAVRRSSYHGASLEALLLRWVEDQEGGAFEALEKAKSQLLALKVGLSQQLVHFAGLSRFSICMGCWMACFP